MNVWHYTKSIVYLGFKSVQVYTTRKSDPKVLLFIYLFFFAWLSANIYRRYHLKILDEIPGQELNEELVCTTDTTVNILRFQMPVKRPKGYCVTRAVRVILNRHRAGRKVFFHPSTPTSYRVYLMAIRFREKKI